MHKEQVLAALGEPDKITNGSQTWIYRTNRLRAYNVFLMPVAFTHEGYYLFFDNTILTRIERRHPRQIVHQASGPGVSSGNKK
jgi:hypothetical protein